MREINMLHRQAMEHTDFALDAQRKGDADGARLQFQRAYELESQAALRLADKLDAEPSRSVLLQSAASLALDCKLFREAEMLICKALSGNPPETIAEELRNLLEQVHFDRHLQLRGVNLTDEEFQLSIDGDDVGPGIATTDAFLGRVQSTEKLLFRTAERQRHKPYRGRGRPAKALGESVSLYMTVPRAASFAVTFKLGGPQRSFPGLSPGTEILDEFLECMAIFREGDPELLKARIPDAAYYNNFVGLARNLVPDGKAVKVVGFTTVRQGQITRQVALTARESDGMTLFESVPTITSEGTGKSVEVVGMLKLADAQQEGNEKINIIDDNGKPRKITVPPGMLDDIVKPLWNARVVITGVQNKRGVIMLQDIRLATDEDQRITNQHDEPSVVRLSQE